MLVFWLSFHFFGFCFCAWATLTGVVLAIRLGDSECEKAAAYAPAFKPRLRDSVSDMT